MSAHKKTSPAGKFNAIYNKYASPSTSTNTTPSRPTTRQPATTPQSTNGHTGKAGVGINGHDGVVDQREIIDLTVEKLTVHNAHYLAAESSTTVDTKALLHTDVVLLSRSDMQMYGLNVYDPVCACINDINYLYTVHPHNKVAHNHCRLHTHNAAVTQHCLPGSTVQLHRVPSKAVRDCTNVKISVQCSNVNLLHVIQQYIRHNLITQHITLHQQFSVKIFDAVYMCAVTAVNEGKQYMTTADDVLDSMKQLTINSDSNTKVAVYRIHPNTRIDFVSTDLKHTTQPVNQLLLDDIGGLKEEIELLRELIELPFTEPELYASYGLTPPRGILLYGRTGTGKTMLAHSTGYTMQTKCGMNVYALNAVELLTSETGDAKLQQMFDQARSSSPSVLIIDNIDLIAPKRQLDEIADETAQRVMATLLTAMDGLHSKTDTDTHCVVIGTTSRIESLDPAVRRSGRFDYEVEIAIPNVAARLDILQHILKRVKHNITDDELQHIASITHGYIGSDLQQLVAEAAMSCVQREYTAGTLDTHVTDSLLTITYSDIEYAISTIKPSAMRELTIDIPNVTWADIGGNDNIKQKLIEAIELPLQQPEAFARLNVEPPRGLLLYGPPGNSKTMIAKALANQSRRNFIAVKSDELWSKYVGDSEKAVQALFTKARAAAPCILFFDEIDALAASRADQSNGRADTGGGSRVTDRVLSQLLVELDGIQALKQVTVLAATNRPDMIDSALLRPGRIDRILYVGLPDITARAAILHVRLRRCAHVLTESDLQDIAIATERYSGAEIIELCNVAGLAAMERDVNVDYVIRADFDTALSRCKPRTTDEAISYFQRYQNRHLAVSMT